MDNLSQKEKQKQLLEEKKRLIAMIKDKQMEIDILKKLIDFTNQEYKIDIIKDISLNNKVK